MKTICFFIATLVFAKKAFSVCNSSSIIIDGYRYTNILQQDGFLQASEYCDREMDSGHLAHIKSDNVSQAVNQLLGGCNESFRIGLEYDTGINGSGWYWTGDVDDGFDRQPLLQDESRWATVEGEGSYNSSACVKPRDGTWIAVNDSSLEYYICETNMLVLQTASEKVYMKVGGDNYLELKIRSIDGPVLITMYQDRNYDAPKLNFIEEAGSVTYKVYSSLDSSTEYDTGFYEFFGTRDDYMRTASTYIFMQDVICSQSPHFPNADIGPGCVGNSSSGTSCNVTCNDGYYVDGIARATCVDSDPSNLTSSDGEWDYGDTKCTRCSNDPTIPNGALDSSCIVDSFGTTCNITCKFGFYVDGTGIASCKDNNTVNDTNKEVSWNMGGTTCTAVKCNTDPTIPNGALNSSCSVGSFLDICNVTCADGYYVDGDRRAWCDDDLTSDDDTNEDGTWRIAEDKCRAVICYEEPEIPNGKVAPGCVSGSNFSTSCNITCNDGYSLRGIASATCADVNQTDDTNAIGVWDYGDTSCTPVICNEEPKIRNGEVSPGCVSGSNFSTSCNITCNDGYTLSDIAMVTCVDVNETNDTNAYGVWDYGDAACTPYPCDEICPFECRDNRTCLCMDEICTEVCPSCRNNSECFELQCRCKSGYQGINGDEVNCIDIDECLDETSCAAIGQSCQNLPGTYQCICTEGYVPSENEDDCIENLCDPTDCGPNAGCYDTSTNDCSCFVGFKDEPDHECSDIDECASYVSACSDTEICRNTIGSYYCECIAGYTRTENDVCIPNSCPPDVIRCSSSNFLIDLCDSAMDDVTNITFPSSLTGYPTTSRTICGENTTNADTPLGSRMCELDGTWSTVTWLMSCGTGLLEVASQSIESEEQRQQVSASLQILTSNPETIDSDDVALISGAIQNITNSTEDITETTATSVITTISNLMESPGLDDSGQSAELLTQLDLIASLVLLNDSDVFKAVSRNVSVAVTSSTSTEGGVGVTMLVRPNSTKIGFRSDQFTLTTSSTVAGSVINGQRIQASIHIPKNASRGASKLSFNVIGNTNLFPTNSTAASLEGSEVLGKINVSMLVLSATVENRNITDLPPDGRLIYSLPVPYDNERQNRSCVYWLEAAGNWDDRGCSVNGSTPDTLTCSCDHLTNFAALLGDISGSPGLRYTTIVGCSISAFALLILVLLFFCIPKTRTGKKFKSSFLLLNLSLALLGLNITILVSEMPSVVYEEDSCRSIAVFLHAFLLASCAWMNCEAVMLILAVVKPIYTAQRLTDMRVVVASISWGWVMPAIFVSIVALYDMHTDDISVYENPQEDESVVTCWIHPDDIYLAYIPTAIMIGVNLIVYAILTYQLCLKQNGKLGKAKNSSKERYERKLGINFSILMLLGLTWIFGLFLPIEDETTALAFAYIFTILNSLQGLFLLLLYIVRNEDVRKSVQTKLTTFSEIFAPNNATSTISDQSGKLNLSATKEESSSNTDNWKSPYGEYVSTEVADPRTTGNYND